MNSALSRHRDEALLVAGALVLGLEWTSASPSGLATWTLVVFGLAAAVGELLKLDAPRLGRVPVSPAVLGAVALLGVAPWESVAVGIGGWVVAAAVRSLRSESSQLSDLTGRIVLAWALPGAAALGSRLAPQPLVDSEPVLSAGALIGVCAVLVVGPALSVAARSHDHGGDFLPVFKGQLQAVWSSGLALGSTAGLAAVAYGLLGAVVLPVMALPLLALHLGLGRHGDIRRTYEQTIVAMTRMTELTGHVAPGHGVRVGDLAVAVARHMGLDEDDVDLARRTAHLHEVGRISTDDPERAAQDRDVAIAGAAVVRETGSMPQVARLIERHRDPYRIPGVGEDRGLPIVARIVHSCCEFDRVRVAGGEEWAALDELHRSMAYEHDPNVVQALSHVVTRGRVPATAGFDL